MSLVQAEIPKKNLRNPETQQSDREKARDSDQIRSRPGWRKLERLRSDQISA